MKKWMSLLAVIALSTSSYADCSFDDFENNPEYSGDGQTNADNQTDLGASFNYYKTADDMFFDGGYWYAYNDADNKGNSSAVPDYMTDKEFEGGLEQGGNGGSTQCLHISITLGDPTDEYNTAFYGIGANLKADGDYFDMSKMTALSFYAKGSGSMNAKFLTKVTSSYAWGDMVSQFDLSSDWTKVTVSPADIVPEPWSPAADDNITWDDVKDAVTKIHFQTNGDDEKSGDKVDFYIDDIVIEGMTYDDFGSSVSVADAKVVANDVKLGNAYPNPFNPTTTINFALPTSQKVSLKVFDAAGNLVKTLYNGITSGTSVNWNATNVNGAKVASGVYFYRLTSGSKVVTKKMVLLK